jgi:hypothetical protein
LNTFQSFQQTLPVFRMTACIDNNRSPIIIAKSS